MTLKFTPIAVLLPMFIMSGCDRTNWNERSITASKSSGSAIIAAISAYHAAHRSLPQQLDKLVPAFLPSIQPPEAGERIWRYHVDERGYELAFRSDSAAGRKTWYFRSDTSKWYYDDGD